MLKKTAVFLKANKLEMHSQMNYWHNLARLSKHWFRIGEPTPLQYPLIKNK